MYLINCMIIS